MIIQFERSGGFTGIPLRATIDVDQLADEEKHPLVDLIQMVDFFGLPATFETSKPAPDRFHYRLTIQDANRRHSIEASEPNVPDQLQPLINQVARLARKTRKP